MRYLMLAVALCALTALADVSIGEWVSAGHEYYTLLNGDFAGCNSAGGG